MKKITFFAISACFMLVFNSCGGNSSKPDSTTTATPPAKESSAPNQSSETKQSTDKASTSNGTEKKADEQPSNNCEQFLKEYDEWTTEYIEFLKEMKADPTNTELATKSLEYASKGTEWAEDWKKLDKDCVSNRDFLKKYNDITTKYTKALLKH